MNYQTLTRDQQRLVRRWRAESRAAMAAAFERRDISTRYAKGRTDVAAMLMIAAKQTLATLRAQGIEPATVR